VIPEPSVRRLLGYVRWLATLDRRGVKVVRSPGLASACGTTAAEVRRDLVHCGRLGEPGRGYSVPALLADLRRSLALDRPRRLALVGAGRLGEALLHYEPLRRSGYRFVAAFDIDPSKIGRPVARGIQTLPMAELGRAMSERGVEMAVVAVPAEAAQQVVAELTAAGARAILNFAPVRVAAPPAVTLRQVDLAGELDSLACAIASGRSIIWSSSSASPSAQAEEGAGGRIVTQA
jgi:redox-sensing transcriptional repressor